jgi:hypothetical protein
MALVIEVIGPHLISVAHYGEQNGDPMCDPEMIFSTATTDGSFLPVSYRNEYVGSFRQRTTVDAAGQPVGFMPGEVRDQVSFANTWARNLKEQGFIAAAKRPAPGSSRSRPARLSSPRITVAASCSAGTFRNTPP